MSRWTIIAIIAALLLIGGVCFAVWHLYRPQPSPPIEVTVISVRGDASWTRMGREEALKAGQRLLAKDMVRTSHGGRVVLRFEDGTRVTVEPETSLTVGQLDESLSKLRFDYGLLAADVVVNNQRKFMVEAMDGEASAQTSGAGFEIAGDRNVIVVAVTSGEVDLAGAGGNTVRIGPSQRATVRRGQAPSQPGRIPDSVFLEVRWPPTLLRERRATVKGKTEPGARVRIDGTYTRVDSEGNFLMDMEFSPGINKVQVEARAPGGTKSHEISPEIEVDNKPPRVEVDTEGLWETQ